ncbi:MAG: DUF4097 family beta strand repeat-containing protein [Myxococcota bacterium]
MTSSLTLPMLSHLRPTLAGATPPRRARRGRGIQNGLGVGGALALFLMGSDAQAEWTEREFDVSQGGRLVLDASIGSVHVQTHDRDQVEVLVARRGPFPLPDLEMRQEGGDVYIESRDVPVVDWLPAWAGRRVRFEVTVPAHYSIEIETGRGSITVEDAAGHIEARTGHGRVQFQNLEGTLEARSQGGAIEIDECRGSVDLVTGGGAIDIEDVEGDITAHTQGGRVRVRDAQGDLDLRTGGGSIRIDGAQGNVVAHSGGGSIHVHFEDGPEGNLETSGGDIEVWFPAGEAASLEVAAGGGPIEVEHPLHLNGAAVQGALAGDVNGGGGALELRTGGGSVRVREL